MYKNISKLVFHKSLIFHYISVGIYTLLLIMTIIIKIEDIAPISLDRILNIGGVMCIIMIVVTFINLRKTILNILFD